jgi:DNA ligase-1
MSQLELHNSRINKQEILDTAAKEGLTEFFQGLSMALDKLYTFGVKQIPEKTAEDTQGQGLSWDNFLELADALNRRKLTGHAARDAIKLAMDVATESQWNFWYRRILVKDLQVGVSEKTVNKVLKGYPDIPSVPVFECMLAHDSANHESKLGGTKLLEPKLDGVRCLTVVDHTSRTVTQYTRNGKVLENFKHITDALAQHIDDFGRSYVLDGEVISSSFQALMKQVHRKDNVEAADARLVLFDIIPLSEFKAGISTMGQRRRSRMLHDFKWLFDSLGCIDLVTQTEVDLDTLLGKEELKDYNHQIVADGYEGIMIKEPNALYECKRTVNWLKMKPFIEVSLAVTAVEEGTGRNLNKLGALVCEGLDDGRMIKVNVGSGFDDAAREDTWVNRDAVIGQIVEVRADVVTQNQDGTYSLRFPRFLNFRGFKVGEKI